MRECAAISLGRYCRLKIIEKVISQLLEVLIRCIKKWQMLYFLQRVGPRRKWLRFCWMNYQSIDKLFDPSIM